MAEHALQQIGPRLKSWRQKRGLTLDELSELTDVSASTISRLEAGKRAPNLELVVPIARALRLELDDLVPRTVPDPRVSRVTKRIDQVTFEQLSPDSSPSQATKVTFPAPVAGAAPDPKVHDGYEWLYVLSGRLRVVLGDTDIEIGPGEVVEFDTRVPHWFGRVGDEPVEFLSLFGKQGERMHVRATAAAP